MSEQTDSNIEQLRREFFVNEDLIASRLREHMAKVQRYCSVDKSGNVRVVSEVEGAKNRILVALSARAVAARLMAEISEEVSVVELAEAAGLAKDVVSARCAELAKARSIDSSRRGFYRIYQDKIERFLDGLSPAAAA
jgi:DNA-binding transcriptional ArsR family regulator